MVESFCLNPCCSYNRILLAAICLEMWLSTIMFHQLATDANQGDGTIVGRIALVAGLVNGCNQGMLPLCRDSACVEALLE